VGRYVKKPVEIEAIKYTGRNYAEIAGFAPFFTRLDQWDNTLMIYAAPEDTWVKCPVGHYVIKGIQNEFYLCDPEIFAKTYDPA
jgi:hypothetical protein